jgi:quercetin dioxygenase-like cupin family protein
MVGKRVQFDDETWGTIVALSNRKGKSISNTGGGFMGMTALTITVFMLLMLLPVTTESIWAAEEHIVVAPDAIKWGPAPPGLPRAAQAAVVFGNPEREGPFVIRVKAPAGLLVAPHRHSKDEMVTVISGKVGIGMGETVAKDAGKTLPSGGFFHMPAGMAHYAWSEEDSIIQITGVGPFDIIYVKPKDDPRGSQHAQ